MDEKYWRVTVEWALGPLDSADEARKFIAEANELLWDALDSRCGHGPDYELEDCLLPEFLGSSISDVAEIEDEDDD
jgi:hypothetical protein